jgi:RNA polymerase sigma-70 factor (ECF subfamily)
LANAPERAAELLDRARHGDLDAYAAFVRLGERRVRAVLRRLLDDERDVDEAAQDTFVQAWRSLERYRGDAAPFTWLYRIAVNEALQRLRRKRLPVEPLDADTGADVARERAAVTWPSAEEIAENAELRAFILGSLRALPPDLRVPLVLRDVEGWPNHEVARALGISLPAAKSRIHRARMQLRRELEGWLADRS